MTVVARDDEPIVRHVDIAVDHPAFDGHFPGQPVLPGVVLLAQVIEAARTDPALAACLGESPCVDVVKFLAPVLPGARLAVRFRRLPRGLDFFVDDDDHLAASGRLSNDGPTGRFAP